MTNLFLVEDGEASLGESFASPPLADAGWRFVRATWNSFVNESIGRIGADLIVASGVRARSRLLNFLYWFAASSNTHADVLARPKRAQNAIIRRLETRAQ
jgi:hypothetical protein